MIKRYPLSFNNFNAHNTKLNEHRKLVESRSEA